MLLMKTLLTSQCINQGEGQVKEVLDRFTQKSMQRGKYSRRYRTDKKIKEWPSPHLQARGTTAYLFVDELRSLSI